MKSIQILTALAMFAATSVVAQEGVPQTRGEAKRMKIDSAAKEALSQLFTANPAARDLYDDAYGYAVFSSLKVAFGFSGGGGHGVAVTRQGRQRTYMKMGTAGVGVGLGAQRSDVIILFENKAVFDDFVLRGWQGDASAHAVAGTKGKNAQSSFMKGLALYQISENGLMLQADVAGSKYWINKRLNKRPI